MFFAAHNFPVWASIKKRKKDFKVFSLKIYFSFFIHKVIPHFLGDGRHVSVISNDEKKTIHDWIFIDEA